MYLFINFINKTFNKKKEGTMRKRLKRWIKPRGWDLKQPDFMESGRACQPIIRKGEIARMMSFLSLYVCCVQLKVGQLFVIY
jgi:hypothetical protein